MYDSASATALCWFITTNYYIYYKKYVTLCQNRAWVYLIMLASALFWPFSRISWLICNVNRADFSSAVVPNKVFTGDRLCYFDVVMSANQHRFDCLLNGLFRRRWKKTIKAPVTGLCEGNSPVTGEFPSQRASNAENDSIQGWRHSARFSFIG